MVSAASFSASKMPARLSGIVPMTKQLKRVTVRPVPAPAMIRPAGRKRKSSSAAWNRSSQASGSASIARERPGDAVARSSSTVASTGLPSGVLQAVLHVPDLLGDGGGESGHDGSPAGLSHYIWGQAT